METLLACPEHRGRRGNGHSLDVLLGGLEGMRQDVNATAARL